MEKIEFKPIPHESLVPGQIVSDVPFMDNEITPTLLEFVRLTDTGVRFKFAGKNEGLYIPSADGTVGFMRTDEEFFEVPQEVIDKLKNK